MTNILVVILLLLLGPTTSMFAWSENTDTSGFHLLDVEYLGMKAAKFGCNRDPIYPQQECRDWVGRAAIDFRLRMAEVFYWNNEVHAEGTDAQFRTVGWRWELGLHVMKELDMFYEHHSRHTLDSNLPYYIDQQTGEERRMKFPVEDSYGVRLNFYINDKPHRSLFK